MNKKTIVKLSFIAFMVVIFLWINDRFINISPKFIQVWILSFGVFAPIIYIVIYTVRPLILFPASVLSLSAGLAFGAFWGTIYTLIGATGGAVLSFLVAGRLGHKLKNKTWDGKAKIIQEQLKKNGFIYVLLLRLIPIFNFDMISYLAGISNVRLLHFTLATLLGIIPGTFAYNFLGSSLVNGNMTILILSILVFLIVTIIPLVLSKRLRKKLGFGSQHKGVN